MPPFAATHALSPSRFGDLERLFARRGCSFARGCWCMDYRIRGRIRTASGDLPADPKAEKKARLRALAGREPTPGLLGYDVDGAAVGWVAVGPRTAFARLAGSRVMKPVDDVPAWAIVCFVVPAAMRGQGIAMALIDAASDHARGHGAPAVEAFPHDRAVRSPPQWLWHGTVAMFAGKGFLEIARRTPTRPILRKSST